MAQTQTRTQTPFFKIRGPDQMSLWVGDSCDLCPIVQWCQPGQASAESLASLNCSGGQPRPLQRHRPPSAPAHADISRNYRGDDYYSPLIWGFSTKIGCNKTKGAI